MSLDLLHILTILSAGETIALQIPPRTELIVGLQLRIKPKRIYNQWL
jgi:hypothetical protein